VDAAEDKLIAATVNALMATADATKSIFLRK
jgi:hypothetical protein